MGIYLHHILEAGSTALSPSVIPVHAQKLKRLQSCEGVPQLVEGGVGKHQGRSYVVMELFADENLAVFQQKAALDVAAIKSIGAQHSNGPRHGVTSYSSHTPGPRRFHVVTLGRVQNAGQGLSIEGCSVLAKLAWGRHQQIRALVYEAGCESAWQSWSLTADLLIAGHQTLKLLQGIHTSGWLHRDVKPANFVRTLDSEPASGGQWRIVDFGLAKPYISKDGDIIDPRNGYNEFRGSTNYASVKAHEKEELGGPLSPETAASCLVVQVQACSACAPHPMQKLFSTCPRGFLQWLRSL